MVGEVGVRESRSETSNISGKSLSHDRFWTVALGQVRNLVRVDWDLAQHHDSVCIWYEPGGLADPHSRFDCRST